ncbi:GntR family transcriptional regulator [Faunimonas sp. B44]|uniref:GntR family transcriptional regulator n=1 Tax=Faunimonas sp. B44 TaxID=3461493 RepID=UPI004044C4F1
MLELPERQSLADVICERLEHMILSGVLKPGQPINEKALSDSNGLSRAPIREACRRLEQAGLVEIIVNRGAYVRTISRRTAEELCEIRVVLAIHAGRLAAAAFTKPRVAELKRTMQAIETAARDGDLAAFYRLNHDFHMAIIEAAGNRRLAEIYTGINKELNLFRWRAFQGAPGLDDSVSAHRAIVAALEAGDADALVATVEAHLRAANKRLMDCGIEDD